VSNAEYCSRILRTAACATLGSEAARVFNLRLKAKCQNCPKQDFWIRFAGLDAIGNRMLASALIAMFFFFSNGLGLAGSILVSVLLSIVLLYACSHG
jgi:hypothetical protein